MSGDKAVSNDIHLESKSNGYMRQCKRRMRLSRVNRERRQNRINRKSLDVVSRMIKSFQSSIESGPQYICTCCDQLWYKNSVTKCNLKCYKSCNESLIKSCLTGVTSVNNIEWICLKCHSS